MGDHRREQDGCACSFFIELGTDGNSSSVKVENVAKGKPITLIVGSSKTIVQSVRVVTDKAEETLKPKVELPVGKRYAISVGAEGKVEASAVDRWTTAIRASVVPSWLLAVAEFARIHPVGATA